MAEPMDAGSGHEGPQTPFPARSNGARDLFWGSRGRSPSTASLWPRGVGWLKHLIVLQASPADTREAVPETNDGAVQGRGDDAVGDVAREVGRRTGRTLHCGGAVGGWGRAEKPLIGGGRSSGWALASLPSAPATSSAAVPFHPMKSGSFLHIGSDTEIVDVFRNKLLYMRLRYSRIVLYDFGFDGHRPRPRGGRTGSRRIVRTPVCPASAASPQPDRSRCSTRPVEPEWVHRNALRSTNS